MRFVSNPNCPLLRLSADDYFTLRDAMSGVACFGATGSGKTSGSGKALASAYLRAGMGGLVMCAKHEEVALWQRYARENGRGEDLVLFGDGGDARFNFLDYEMKAQGVHGTGSVTECIMRVLEAERVVMPESGGGGDAFWQRSPRQLLNNTLPVVYAATGTVTIDAVYKFITSAPKRVTDMDSPVWQAGSFMFQTVIKATDDPVAPLDPEEGEKIARFWWDEFAALDDKTRGNIVINLTSTLDRFLRGRLRDHFCRASTITPEDTLRDGKIIVMSMPTQTWNEDGLIGQQVFKYMWQRAVLRRGAMSADHQLRPVFLWADEAQNFINSFDKDYQATCRSNFGCTVYLTQNMPSFVVAMAGSKAKALADQVLGNFTTKIWHANADPETNDWASRTIGREVKLRTNYSKALSQTRSRGRSQNIGSSIGSSGGHSRSFGRDIHSGSSSSTTRSSSDGTGRNYGSSDSESRSEGGSEVMDYAVEPRVFAHELRTGGDQNRREVDAVWFQNGRTFSTTRAAFLPVTFRQ